MCWFFPELKFITRHGGEPWTELAVKLMLKWPNLYYSTSAFAPKHYPKDIIDFANTRGADKIIYAGYFPMGLSLERIFAELPNVPFKDDVWPKFLRENAARVLKLERHVPGPLAGIRVIELPNIGPVQFAGMLLADMGADVLRLDRASDVATGRTRRFRVAVLGDRPGPPQRRHRPQASRRGPGGLAVRTGRRAARGLPARRRGALGVGPEACRARNDRLVYARMTGWGQDGPLAGDVGHDINYLSLAGVLWHIGPEGTRRCRRSTCSPTSAAAASSS